MRRAYLFVAAGVVVLLPACTGGRSAATSTFPEAASISTSTTTPTTLAVTMSDEAAEYLKSALDLMEGHSINRESVDWEALEASAFQLARSAETPGETYSAIAWALEMLNDDHSIFFPPSQAESFTHGEAVFGEPIVETIDNEFGYVSVSRYVGDIGSQADQYATALADSIADTDPGVCGWVVDLTSDSGGNMWPMIAGLSPLLGEGIVGFFTYPDGRTEPWRIEGETAWWSDMAMVSIAHPSGLARRKPIAVLVGSGTASAGEAVAAAFHGAPDVALVGQLTSGLTTSNEPVELSDGALMMLTMSNFTNRNGFQFGQSIPIEPDIPASSADAEIRAVEWLTAHPDCGTDRVP